MPEARRIVQALIRLNRLENEFKGVGERSKRKEVLVTSIQEERARVPGPILAHHNRLRARGRDSTAPVRDWVCRACFITVASGMRTHLAHRDDLTVCENCGSYSYMSDGSEEFPDDTQLLAAARLLVLKLEKKTKTIGIPVSRKKAVPPEMLRKKAPAKKTVPVKKGKKTSPKKKK